MDAEAVRQLMMGIEWVILVRGDTESYRIIGWMDCIVFLDGL